MRKKKKELDPEAPFEQALKGGWDQLWERRLQEEALPLGRGWGGLTDPIIVHPRQRFLLPHSSQKKRLKTYQEDWKKSLN